MPNSSVMPQETGIFSKVYVLIYRRNSPDLAVQDVLLLVRHISKSEDLRWPNILYSSQPSKALCYEAWYCRARHLVYRTECMTHHEENTSGKTNEEVLILGQWCSLTHSPYAPSMHTIGEFLGSLTQCEEILLNLICEVVDFRANSHLFMTDWWIYIRRRKWHCIHQSIAE